MSVNENIKNSVILKKFKIEDSNKFRFLVGKSGVGVQLNEDEALYVARTLALLLGIRVELKDLDTNNTRENRIGDDKEEHF